MPPHGPRRSAAPAAKGGRVRSSAPTSFSRSSRRLHRAPAARLLVCFSAEAGPGTGQSTAVLCARGPSPHPQPCPSGRGCRGDCLARRQEVDVNGANARGPEEGSGKGGGVCSTPTQRSGGVTRRKPYQRLPNANRLKRPNKQTNNPVHLSKKVKSWWAKICMLKLETNEKVGDETFPPGTHERPGANFPNKRRTLGNR